MNTNINQPLYQRVGVKLSYDSLVDSSLVKSLKRALSEPNDGRSTWAFRSFAVTHSGLLAYQRYLLEQYDECRQFASGCITAGHEFFFGEWKLFQKTDNGVIDPEWWHEHVDFGRHYRWILIWGACLGQWEDIQKLSTYPDDECSRDIDQSKEQYWWLLSIASVMRGEAERGLRKYSKEIEASPRGKQEKYLLQILRAIVGEDNAVFNEKLNEYLVYYKKMAPKSKWLTDKLAIDASFLIHLAEHKGFQVRYNDKYRDHIIRLPG